MAVFILTLAVFALFFIFLSVRLIFLKNGEFRGTCASQSPFLNKEGITCGYCGKELKPTDKACGDPEAALKLESLPGIKKK